MGRSCPAAGFRSRWAISGPTPSVRSGPRRRFSMRSARDPVMKGGAAPANNGRPAAAAGRSLRLLRGAAICWQWSPMICNVPSHPEGMSALRRPACITSLKIGRTYPGRGQKDYSEPGRSWCAIWYSAEDAVRGRRVHEPDRSARSRPEGIPMTNTDLSKLKLDTSGTNFQRKQ